MRKEIRIMPAIAGDMIGAPYERRGNRIKTTRFPLFNKKSRATDDSMMTIAVANALASVYRDYDTPDEVIMEAVTKAMQDMGHRYPDAGYGGSFQKWLDDPKPYGSWGNGSAMRVSPAAYVADGPGEVLRLAKLTAEVSHNDPEGVKGAQAVAMAVYYAREGYTKGDIQTSIENLFGYDLNRTVDEIRPGYEFDVSCPGSVPEAIIAFLDSSSYEDAVRKAVSLGGDADTQACIAGAIAGAYYGMPLIIKLRAFLRLDWYCRRAVLKAARMEAQK